MLQLMSWGEIIENFKMEGQLKMAVIFDSSGEKIAETEGTTMTSTEAISLLMSLSTISSNIYGLFLMGSKFRCFHVDKDTLIGQADDNVLVAHRKQNLLICGISSLDSKTSCLGAVKNFVRRLVAEGTPGVSGDSLI